MLTTKKPFLADEELGKKDDDHRPRKPSHFWRSSKQWKPPRLRRIVLGVAALYMLYVFFRNMPTDLSPAPERLNPALAETRQKAGMSWSPTPSSAIPQRGPPPRDEFAPEGSLYYEGSVLFHSLGQTLYRFRKFPGVHGLPASRAVVFAGASLKSISDLLPLACKMAYQRANEVHLVLMGRDDVSIEGIQHVNGIDGSDCPIYWHDGRVDYAQWSTDARMERAVAAGLVYVQAYLSPQAVITQGESLEEVFFLQGIEKKARELSTTHIVLPTAARDVMWMSSLDSQSLQAWNDVRVEILIQAPTESSGSFIRLIRSLKDADYLGSVPGLTIELPHDVDPELLQFLKTMKWPSDASNKVTLRRRVRHGVLDAAEAALRTAEAFYPQDPNMTHVLMLSPQTELSVSFYHYLKHTVLKYKYSANAGQTASDLLGISLELPSSLPTKDESFNSPIIDTYRFASLDEREAMPVSLGQVPNSNAALYFGDKWVEFQSFISERLAKEETSSHEKVISERYPAVMEYLLEFMRARDYYLLYPAASGTQTLVTVHSDLFQIPEEYSEEGWA
ncbi:hypothetical protein ANOM_006324 [Aspergillus nomiae NRRL 13137]|uniref:Uncharacterized protein n=1 Tax=Aspergillus nomiae NRRL (strain ATCC 15546 / NRRL 13137 / CBS 260.88 / M93) TaxID=1509407 RepID=A0A0L1J100_ASPN3|nr:uncharacterized protein ANOM_006324 [Aspergillus nomiae NRRL 13137]KNG85345.1 hypothetical protein ANOM_006324 [Aspergillus nomiae NRRL 13137]